MGELISATGVRVALVVAAAATSLIGCRDGRRDAAIIQAALTDDRTLVLTISACGGDDNRAAVSEQADAVAVNATTDDPVGGDDCADGLTVQLQDPLGDRRLIDGATGDSVLVYDDR